MTKEEINDKIFEILSNAEKEVNELIKNENVKVYEDYHNLKTSMENNTEPLDACGIFLAIYDNTKNMADGSYRLTIMDGADMKKFDKDVLELLIDRHKRIKEICEKNIKDSDLIISDLTQRLNALELS